jgi:hypothetical protein
MRLAPSLLLLAACTLDPRSVIENASLRVQVEGVPTTGATVVLTALDANGRQLVKRAPLTGQSSVEVIFEQGTLMPGTVDVGGVVLDQNGAQLACGAARADSSGMSVMLTLSLANDNANCGACGRTCDQPANGARDCEKTSATCGPIVCTSGWFDVNGDPLDGCETTCAAPAPEESTVTCKDTLDNDCDGKNDCADDGCAGFVRACSYLACTGQQTWDCASDTWGACTANEGLENSVAACSDGLDNDCDGKKDCADETCAGFTQSCTFQTCPGQQSWTCSSASWGTCAVDQAREATAAACSDGQDNDCDGQTDCQDSACLNNPESTIATCGDGRDNDCDGKTDCQDSDCLNIRQGCSGNLCAGGIKTWLCSAQLFSLCIPYISLPENSLLVCGDGLDNDCDLKTDCADPECGGKQCAGGKVCCPNGTCSASCP